MPYSDTERQKSYKREWARMDRAGDCGTPGGTQVPISFRLQTAQDVIDLLQEQVGTVLADTEVGTLERARTIGYLAGIALKAIEAGNIAARLETLEMVLKRRKEDEKS